MSARVVCLSVLISNLNMGRIGKFRVWSLCDVFMICCILGVVVCVWSVTCSVCVKVCMGIFLRPCVSCPCLSVCLKVFICICVFAIYEYSFYLFVYLVHLFLCM